MDVTLPGICDVASNMDLVEWSLTFLALRDALETHTPHTHHQNHIQ